MHFQIVNIVKVRFIFLLLLFCPLLLLAQQPAGVFVSGKISFSDNAGRFDRVKIYNLRTNTFVSPAKTGIYELHGYKTDTFVFVCIGYSNTNLCYKDSLRQLKYEKNIVLHPVQTELEGVTITPDKSFEQIQQAIDNLGVKNTDTYKTVEPLQSPITFLWERFSKLERQKRQVAVLLNEDERRQVQRELLKICIKSELINLSLSKMDAFIEYCNFSDVYLQQVSLYDLLSMIKLRYEFFSKNFE